VENENAGLQEAARDASTALQQGTQRKAIQAQIVNMEADTRKKVAEEALTAETARKAQYETAIAANSAGNVHLLTRQLNLQGEKLRHEIESIIQQRKITELTEDQQRKLMPLLLEAQKLENQSSALGLPEQQATAAFWEDVGGVGKAIKPISEILRLLQGRERPATPRRGR
jgi:hypothetical protein